MRVCACVYVRARAWFVFNIYGDPTFSFTLVEIWLTILSSREKYNQKIHNGILLQENPVRLKLYTPMRAHADRYFRKTREL